MTYVDSEPDRKIQTSIVQYLTRCHDANHAPTIGEVADATGESSNAVAGMLRRFHRHGMIITTDGDGSPRHTLSPAALADMRDFISRLPIPLGPPKGEAARPTRPRLDRTLATAVCHMGKLDDPITAEALGACLGIEHPKTIGLLKRLTNAEWVVCNVPDPDTTDIYPTWQLTGLGERRVPTCATYLAQAVPLARFPRHVTATDIAARITPGGNAELTITGNDTADHNGVRHTTIVHLDEKLLARLRGILNAG